MSCVFKLTVPCTAAVSHSMKTALFPLLFYSTALIRRCLLVLSSCWFEKIEAMTLLSYKALRNGENDEAGALLSVFAEENIYQNFDSATWKDRSPGRIAAKLRELNVTPMLQWPLNHFGPNAKAPLRQLVNRSINLSQREAALQLRQTAGKLLLPRTHHNCFPPRVILHVHSCFFFFFGPSSVR